MNRTRGFTLIEILVALTLFAVIGGTLLQLFSQGLRSARIAGAHEHAVLLARSKLTELQAYSQLSPGVYQGVFDDGYRWRAELTPADVAGSSESARLRGLDLRLTISWGDIGEQRDFALTSRLLTRRSDSG